MNNGLSADAVERLRNKLWDRMEATEMGEACAFRKAIDLLDAAVAEAQPINVLGLTEQEKCTLHFFPKGCTCPNMTAYNCPFHLAVKALTD